MTDNKTRPTNANVADFISDLSLNRQNESKELIEIMSKISKLDPIMWGPSIIGFGSQHYKYDSGREGDMPILSFSPRKQAISVYFAEGFDRYSGELSGLGKYKASVSCLYITKLTDIDLNILKQMLKKSFKVGANILQKPTTVDEYCRQVPAAALPRFNELRKLVKRTLPNAQEVLSYGVIGYKIDEKRPRIFISGWKDHLGVYPVPKEAGLKLALQPYQKGKGTLWFSLSEPLPKDLIIKTIKSLVQ
jgi:uncharacterized protein YdhG (YjbR/CyaY superfamily)